jgi:uncharacterized membrane protein YozB (DUF420 family)
MTMPIPPADITADIKEATVKTWRVKPSIKITVIVLSILALSLFFEGWRQVKSSMTVWHFAIMLSGTVTTILLLWVQAFWIYVEEKSKGTLKKKVLHFDRLQEYLENKRRQTGK